MTSSHQQLFHSQGEYLLLLRLLTLFLLFSIHRQHETKRVKIVVIFSSLFSANKNNVIFWALKLVYQTRLKSLFSSSSLTVVVFLTYACVVVIFVCITIIIIINGNSINNNSPSCFSILSVVCLSMSLSLLYTLESLVNL